MIAKTDVQPRTINQHHKAFSEHSNYSSAWADADEKANAFSGHGRIGKQERFSILLEPIRKSSDLKREGLNDTGLFWASNASLQFE
jgi:hypothetical protein